MSDDLVLQVRDLNVWYRPSGTVGRRKRQQVLHDVSFELHRGEILGLVGESGSGKTTLARTILGFVPDYTGTITHYTKRPQMVFQDPASSLNPSRTVGWILAEPLRIYGKYGKEEIVRRMAEEGHLIGNHTYSHVKLSGMAPEAACEEIRKTSDLIQEITGKPAEYIRPPFGEWDKSLECGLTLFPVLWTVDTLDWTTENVSDVVRRGTEKVKDGDVILLHDCYASSVKAALEIIDTLKSRGFQFVTADERILE